MVKIHFDSSTCKGFYITPSTQMFFFRRQKSSLSFKLGIYHYWTNVSSIYVWLKCFCHGLINPSWGSQKPSSWLCWTLHCLYCMTVVCKGRLQKALLTLDIIPQFIYPESYEFTWLQYHFFKPLWRLLFIIGRVIGRFFIP